MLIQHQPRIQQEGNIVFHIHINGILQRGNRKQLRILIIGPIQGIIQPEKFPFVVKEKPKYRIFILPVRMDLFTHDSLLSGA